ncbi:MAG: beta-galactosidase, partial [Lachnospiraceae bacterium]|nr:beta-galactosidase [Lachnospiraceae bacterium]
MKSLLENFIYGGDYNPEQWLDCPDILDEDLRLMKKAHINCVTLGVFSWSLLEPKEGQYEFEWLEKIIHRLYENGIFTILATPSGARPKWLSDKYPEVLRTREDRTKYLYGGRHNHCFTSPIYREKVGAINRELAKRFGKNSAVILWHISNEFGGECHCPLCQNAFQVWLQNKYKTIDNLNKAWWTTFWSHTYTEFAQVESPSSIGENSLHGLVLDWKRFTTDQNIDYMKSEIEELRKGGALQPVTTNFMYDIPEANYTKMAKELDIISWDTYPTWHKYKEDDMAVALDNSMQHDFMRSLQHKPYLMMES